MKHPNRTREGQPAMLALKHCLRANLIPAELCLWAKLRSNQLPDIKKFRRQHGTGPYIIDLYCPAKNLVIKIDGDVQAEGSVQRKDVVREKYPQSLGLRGIRYTNDEALNNLDGVLEDLLAKIL